MAESPRQRLFFALWPPSPVARHVLHNLKTTLARNRGKWQREDQLHITLAFLGGVSPVRAQCVQQAAASVSAPAFSLQLTQLGYFPRAGVLWLGPAVVPDALNRLYAELNEALREQCDIEPERRRFHPHLTLLRKSRRPPPVNVVGPIDWPVSEFVLVESRTLPEGAVYDVVNRWSLNRP